jgi:transcriptional regulator with XRE-family HTH domain
LAGWASCYAGSDICAVPAESWYDSICNNCENVMPKSIAASKLATTNTHSQIGGRLHALRKKQKLSVSKLATRAKVSVGMISQIERSLTNPSIRTLERLRHALSVPLSALLEDEVDRGPVLEDHRLVRKVSERPHFQVGDQGMTKELLSPQGDHDLQMMIIALPAGASSKEVLIGEGEKAGLVLSGTVVIEVAGNRQELSEGDSFQFRSMLPHSVHNETRESARLLWIMNTKRLETHL